MGTVNNAIFFVSCLSAFAFLFIGTGALGFEFEPFPEPTPSNEGGGFVDWLFGEISLAIDVVGWSVLSVFQVVVGIVKIATFNVPGAPVWVTTIFTAAIASTLVLGMAYLIRGGGNS